MRRNRAHSERPQIFSFTSRRIFGHLLFLLEQLDNKQATVIGRLFRRRNSQPLMIWIKGSFTRYAPTQTGQRINLEIVGIESLTLGGINAASEIHHHDWSSHRPKLLPMIQETW